MLRYSVLLELEDDGSAYNVLVPSLPGCFTWGTTSEEALANAHEAIVCHLRGLAKDGEPIPVERSVPILKVVELPIDVADLTVASLPETVTTPAS